jgi:hypothetical protein
VWDPDGTKNTFDYEVPASTKPPSTLGLWPATSWYLTKREAPTAHWVQYNYPPGETGEILLDSIQDSLGRIVRSIREHDHSALAG